MERVEYSESRWHIIFFRGCLAQVPGQYLALNIQQDLKFWTIRAPLLV